MLKKWFGWFRRRRKSRGPFGGSWARQAKMPARGGRGRGTGPAFDRLEGRLFHPLRPIDELLVAGQNQLFHAVVEIPPVAVRPRRQPAEQVQRRELVPGGGEGGGGLPRGG